MGFGGFYVVYAEGEWGFYNTPLNHGTVRILEAEQMLGAGGRSAHLQAPRRRIPGCLGTGCQCSLGRREGGSPPPCLPCAPGGCRWSSRRKPHSYCLNRAAQARHRDRALLELPGELCTWKAHPKFCLSNSFTTTKPQKDSREGGWGRSRTS